MTAVLVKVEHSAHSPGSPRMAIRLEDLSASFRWRLRAVAQAPRTIELYSQSVRSSAAG